MRHPPLLGVGAILATLCCVCTAANADMTSDLTTLKTEAVSLTNDTSLSRRDHRRAEKVLKKTEHALATPSGDSALLLWRVAKTIHRIRKASRHGLDLLPQADSLISDMQSEVDSLKARATTARDRLQVERHRTRIQRRIDHGVKKADAAASAPNRYKNALLLARAGKAFAHAIEKAAKRLKKEIAKGLAELAVVRTSIDGRKMVGGSEPIMTQFNLPVSPADMPPGSVYIERRSDRTKTKLSVLPAGTGAPDAVVFTHRGVLPAGTYDLVILGKESGDPVYVRSPELSTALLKTVTITFTVPS